MKEIGIRGSILIVKVYKRLAFLRLNESRNSITEQAVKKFLNWGELGDKEVESRIRAAQLYKCEEGDEEIYIPTQVKLVLDISDEDWDAAIAQYKRCCGGVSKVIISRFITVVLIMFLQSLEEKAKLTNQAASNPAIIDVMSLDDFKRLDISEKLDQIYLLLSRGGRP